MDSAIIIASSTIIPVVKIIAAIESESRTYPLKLINDRTPKRVKGTPTATQKEILKLRNIKRESVLFGDLIEEENKCFLWRFMIDRKYQGKGFGKIALTQVIDFVRSLNLYTYIATSYVPAENGAGGFYKNFGFIESEEITKEFGTEHSDEIGIKYTL